MFFFLQRVERELHGKQQQLQQAAHSHVFQYTMSQDEFANTTPNTLPHMLNIDIAMQQKQQGKEIVVLCAFGTLVGHLFVIFLLRNCK